ncbi:hypothetical protein SAMN04515617_10138 [Collimonas sp. OK242]|nr:hypothetical protein SAMN04515617_10138 [Collimonas sp. OK242]
MLGVVTKSHVFTLLMTIDRISSPSPLLVEATPSPTDVRSEGGTSRARERSSGSAAGASGLPASYLQRGVTAISSFAPRNHLRALSNGGWNAVAQGGQTLDAAYHSIANFAGSIFTRSATASAPTAAPAVLDVTPTALDHEKNDHSVTQARFGQFMSKHQAVFSPSASAGRDLRGLNDAAGVLMIPARDGRFSVMERLKVVADTVRVSNTATEQRLFVVGYGGRPVKLDELDLALEEINAAPGAAVKGKGKAAATEMETPLRSAIMTLSERSPLSARRDRKESDDKFMLLPPNPSPLPRRSTWANAEHAMPHGVGTRDGDGFFPIYMDHNKIENHLLIFKKEKQATPGKNEAGHPTSVNMDGAVLADIQGIKSIEVMGPAGQEMGVKGAKLRSWTDLERGPAPRADVTLHISTEDGAVHRLVLGDNGIKMSLINPQPALSGHASGRAFGLDEKMHARADVDVYSYQGRDTGKTGSKDGFPDSELILSTGDKLKAGPLLKGPPAAALASAAGGIRRFTGDTVADAAAAATEVLAGHGQSLAKLVLGAATMAPTLAGGRGAVTYTLNLATKSFVTAAVVVGLNDALKFYKHSPNGAIAGGSHGFSAAGGQSVSPEVLFCAITSMVVVQEALTHVFSFVGKFVPAQTKDRETKASVLLNDLLVPAIPEFTRLVSNLLVQKGFGFNRGSKADVAGLLAASLVNAGIDQLWKNRVGEEENHPAAHSARAIVRFINDVTFRSLGNTYNSTKFNPDTVVADYREAIVTRLATRSLDKLVLPIVATVLNGLGIVGPNAGAYDGQIERERGFNNAISVLLGFANDVAAIGDRMGAHFGDIKKIRDAVFSVTDSLEQVKQWSNRIMLKPKGRIDGEIMAVQDAIEFHQMAPQQQQEYLGQLEQTMTEMVANLTAQGASSSSQPGPGNMPTAQPVQNNRSQLPPKSAAYMARLDQDHTLYMQQATKDTPGYSAYPVNVSFDGKAHPAGATAAPFGLSDSAKIPKTLTTWSWNAQAYALPTHEAMLKGSGLESMRMSTPDLSHELQKNIIQAVRDYTIESQYFHYPLRWETTGQAKHQPVVPGIDFVYNIMNKPGNIEGPSESHRMGGDEHFDPIEAIHINLGALHSKKFPAIVQRAVVTEAPYVERKTADTPDWHVASGDVATLTEILSATMSSRLAAAFGQALGFGAAPKAQNQRLVMRQQTALNISAESDLGQAEVIVLPGALYSIRHVDKSPPKPQLQPGESQDLKKDIGQVVYMDSIDTGKLEKRYCDFLEGKLTEADHGASMVHPESGHFHTYDAKSRQAVYVAPTKNYFLGKPLETSSPSTEHARWRHPYTSDFSPRTTKDAIHAAILRGDPIVAHLDDATKNIHHEHFRLLNGYYETPTGVSEVERKAAVRKQAADISAAFPDRSDQILTASHGMPGEMLAWTTASMLRKPISMVRVGAGHEIDVDSRIDINKTYDKVSLHAEPAVMIGVGDDGFYAIRNQDGKHTALKMDVSGEGHSAGNLLHVFHRAAYADDRQYKLATKADGSSHLSAGKAEKSTVDQLLTKLKGFAQTSSYMVWEQALVDKFTALGGNPVAPAEDMAASGKQKA